MKFTITQILWTSLVPKHTGQKNDAYMKAKINLCHYIAANFTKLTTVQCH